MDYAGNSWLKGEIPLRIFFLLLIFLLSSCAGEVSSSFLAAEELALYHLRITRGKQPQFTGLLAVQRLAAGGEYRLLDASGITLLVGQWPENRDTGVMKESALAPFIRSALTRIFTIVPDKGPCSGLLTRLCCDRTQGGLAKEFSFLFLPWWTVVGGGQGWRYTLHPAGIEMILQEVDMAGEEL